MRNFQIDDENLNKPWPQARPLNERSIIVLTGPTAAGKSALALQLAIRLDAEIVCADSMQIYKGLDIGTAKASPKEQAQVPHHLLDLCEVHENYSTARYVEAAKHCFNDIIRRGKTPLLVGGTTLYISALVENMQFPDQEFDTVLRERLLSEAQSNGPETMYKQLLELDPAYAAQLHPNNQKRVLRALERLYSSRSTDKERLLRHASEKSEYNEDFDYRVFCVSQPRQLLYQRINARVEQMIKEGLLEEAAWLLKQNLPQTATCMQAIGYKELFPYLRGEQKLAEVSERLKANTRQYAKRQLTWFRAKVWPMWLFPKTTEEACELILKEIMPES